MAKLLKPYDRDSMKIAMIRHEETFREQVYELHRLYRVQKTLMRSIGSGEGDCLNPNNLWQKKPRTKLDLERPAEGGFTTAEVGDESQMEIELTLGPAVYNRRNRSGTLTTLTSDSGPTFSSSSTGSSRIKQTSSGAQYKGAHAAAARSGKGDHNKEASIQVEERSRSHDRLKCVFDLALENYF